MWFYRPVWLSCVFTYGPMMRPRAQRSLRPAVRGRAYGAQVRSCRALTIQNKSWLKLKAARRKGLCLEQMNGREQTPKNVDEICSLCSGSGRNWKSNQLQLWICSIMQKNYDNLLVIKGHFQNKRKQQRKEKAHGWNCARDTCLSYKYILTPTEKKSGKVFPNNPEIHVNTSATGMPRVTSGVASITQVSAFLNLKS